VGVSPPPRADAEGRTRDRSGTRCVSPDWHAPVVGRFVLVAFGVLLLACGSHAEADNPRVDPLLALESDPQAALAAAKHPTYRATYEMTLSSLFAAVQSPSPGPSLSSTQTYIARPPDFRFELAISRSVPLRMVIILRGQDAFVCLDGNNSGCYAMPVTYTQQMLDSLNVSPLDSMLSATRDMDVTVLPRERIADRDAACFRWRLRPTAPGSPSPTSLNSLLGQIGEVKLEACFSADGVMLRTLTSAGALFTIQQRATSVSTTVSDADFALPYPLTSAPFPLPTSGLPKPQTPRPSATVSPTKH